MNVTKGFEYFDKLPWLEGYIRTITLTRHATPQDIARVFELTRWIKVGPIEKLNFDSTETCHYEYAVPKPQIGATKPLDVMACGFTAPGIFRLSPEGKTRRATECSLPREDTLFLSGSGVFVFGFPDQPENRYYYEYLPSTGSVRDGVTALCEKHGHRVIPAGWRHETDCLIPHAFVVSRMLSNMHGETIYRSYNIYAPAEGQRWWGMEPFCKSETHKTKRT